MDNVYRNGVKSTVWSHFIVYVTLVDDVKDDGSVNAANACMGVCMRAHERKR